MKGTGPSPPRIGEKILRSVLPDNERPALLGDFEELFRDIVAERGSLAAELWYWRQVLITFTAEIWNSGKWSILMIANYMRVAFRNLKKQKIYSLINITGLAVGLACCIFILLWVHDERIYDRFHERAAGIARVCIVDDNVGTGKKIAVTPLAMAPALVQEVPEILSAARLSSSSMRMISGDQGFDQQGLLVSVDFLRMFSFRLLQGDPETALSSLDSIVITEETALKLFRGENPIGQVIKSRGGPEYTVTGVLRDIPQQSHLDFDYLLNFQVLGRNGRDLDNWGNISFYTYIELREGVDPQAVARKITACSQAHFPELQAEYFLQPLLSIYLDSAYMFDPARHGSRQNVIAFSLIAVAVLLMAVFNFVNLSTARAGRRSVEVGLRKVVGAGRTSLVRQFMSESMAVTVAASLLAVGAVAALLPTFNTVAGKRIPFLLLIRGGPLVCLAGIVLFTGLASGFYPALYLSAFRPSLVLKSAVGVRARKSLLRRALIVFQFALTIGIIIAVLAVGRQMRFMQRMDLGFDKTNLVAMPLRGEISSRTEELKQRLLRNPYITAAAAASNLPGRLVGGTLVEDWEGKSVEGRIHLKVFWVDADYLETFRMEMTEGRFFSRSRDPERTEYVINQAAVRAMGLESPVGTRASITDEGGTIIGVVKDFNFRSLHHDIEPMVLIHNPARFSNMVIRLAPEALNRPETLGFIESLWKEEVPDIPFSYSFVDQRLAGLYGNERLMGVLLRCFTGLSILIACLGLLGLASFMAEQRRKEIGIRKVLGASFSNIIRLLLKEFSILAVAANLIAWPVAFFVLRRWLENFAFRTNLAFWTFFLSGGLALVLSMLTVGYQSVRAGISNPIESLKYE